MTTQSAVLQFLGGGLNGGKGGIAGGGNGGNIGVKTSTVSSVTDMSKSVANLFTMTSDFSVFAIDVSLEASSGPPSCKTTMRAATPCKFVVTVEITPSMDKFVKGNCVVTLGASTASVRRIFSLISFIPSARRSPCTSMTSHPGWHASAVFVRTSSGSDSVSTAISHS